MNPCRCSPAACVSAVRRCALAGLLFGLINEPGPPAVADQAGALAISRSGSGVVISWTNASVALETALRLTGPWGQVPGAVSPYAVLPTNSASFYRLIGLVPPPPTGLSLEAFGDYLGYAAFFLSWEPAPNAASYNLYFAADSSVTKSNYASLPQGTAIFGITNLYQTVQGLVPGVRYYFVSTAVSPYGESADSNQATGVFGPPVSVSGEIDIQLVFGTNIVQVPLPGISVTLSNLSDPTLFAQVTTDPDGAFEFDNRPPGNYQLCWSANGFVSDCYSSVLAISNSPIALDVILISPVTNETTGLVYGQITLQDGSVPVFQDPFYQISVSPVVTLTGTNGSVLTQVAPNSSGQYVITGAPLAPSLGLSARVEQASVSNTINTFLVGEADLVIPETPPVISNVVATLGGQPVFRVPAGATVQVMATAGPNGSALQYQWFQADGSLLPNGSGSNAVWTLPNTTDGFSYLFLRVSDGFGGYAVQRLGLTTDSSLLFSGQATGSNLQLSANGTLVAPPVANALVQVNETAANTDANGYFSLLLAQTNQYVLSVSADGYAPLAKLFQQPETEKQYLLIAISSAPCTNDTTQTIYVTNGSAFLTIPANSLSDAVGNPYPAASVSLDLLDPCDLDNQFHSGNLIYPGDTNSGVLDPFAVASIQITNCYGQPLFVNPTNCLISPDSTNCVQLCLPIAVACATASNVAPPTADFFFLDPVRGMWRYLATGARTAQGYIVNIVLPKAQKIVVAAGAAVLPWGALDIYSDTTLHLPFRVGFFKSDPGNNNAPGAEFVANGSWRDVPTDQWIRGQDWGRVQFLPVGTVWIKLLDLRQAPGACYTSATGDEIPDSKKTVIQVIKATVKAYADSPPNKVRLGLGIGTDTPRLAQLTAATQVPNEAAKAPDFLGKLKSSEADAKAYYKAIGASNALPIPLPFKGKQETDKTTFAGWQILNAWPTNGWAAWADESAAIAKINGPGWWTNDDLYALYFNANDLGAGRRMGMKKTVAANGNTYLAYYVATYANLPDAVKGRNLKYIVCMEYSPHADIKSFSNTPFVKFYAYDRTGSLSESVPDEDRHRPLFVPGVCNICHGGGSKTQDDKGAVGGQFVAFDTASYTFSKDANWGHTPGQMGMFKNLNSSLLGAKTLPNGQGELMPTQLPTLINHLITANGYTAAPPNGWLTNATPEPDATKQKQLYNNMYAVSCRSCHSTREAAETFNGAGGLWGIASNGALSPKFKSQPNPVKPRVMPHAQRTFSIFWGSATGEWLNDNGILTQSALSQPAILSLDGDQTQPGLRDKNNAYVNKGPGY